MNSLRPTTRLLAVDCLVAVGLLLMINLAAGPTGFWSADEAVAHQQVELLTVGRWSEPVPEPDLDPEGRWHPMNPLSLGDGVVGPYVKHPLFPFLLRLGDMALGPIGRFAVPALSSVLAALVIAAGAARRRPGSARSSFWLVLTGTPLLFHGAMLWAHAPAIALAAVVCLTVQAVFDGVGADHRVDQPSSTTGLGTVLTSSAALVGHAAVVAAMVMLRTEAAIFTVVVGTVLLGSAAASWPRSRPGATVELTSTPTRLATMGVVTIIVTVAAYLTDELLRVAILGSGGDSTLTVPPEPLFDLRVRGGLLWRWLIGTTPDMGLGIGRIIGAILLAMAAISARPGSRLTLSPWLGLAGGLLYLPALLSESTVAVAPAAPAVLVGLLVTRGFDPFVRFVAVVSVAYFTAVVATSYANGGGGDWGGRYLALLIAPLAIVGLPELYRIIEQRPLRPLLAGTAIAGIALAVAMSVDVINARRDTSDLALGLAAEIDGGAELPELVVTTDSRIGRLLGNSDLDTRLLQVPTESMPELADRLPPGTELLIIDLFDRFDAPEAWTVHQRTATSVRVTSAD